MPTAANLEGATIQMSLMSWEALKREQVDNQLKIDQLEAQLRETRPTTRVETRLLIRGLLGARRVIGFAISHLSPAERTGWPVAELRQFLDGLAAVDSGDPNVKDSVHDFRAFADEIDQAEVERKARIVTEEKRPTEAEDSADAIVARLFQEAEELTQAAQAEAGAQLLAQAEASQPAAFEDAVRDVGAPKIEHSLDYDRHDPA